MPVIGVFKCYKKTSYYSINLKLHESSFKQKKQSIMSASIEFKKSQTTSRMQNCEYNHGPDTSHEALKYISKHLTAANAKPNRATAFFEQRR